MELHYPSVCLLPTFAPIGSASHPITPTLQYKRAAKYVVSSAVILIQVLGMGLWVAVLYTGYFLIQV